MPEFKEFQQGRRSPDPAKHVRYSRGMVLGVDDLTQEFAYHSARDRWIVRDLLGSGIVWGLGVSVERDEVSVDAGVAVCPSGQLVRVNVKQCASLVEWLKQNTEALGKLEKEASPRVAVVLEYAESLTDHVPIAAEHAFEEKLVRQEESRIQDHFNLRLSLDPRWHAAPGACPAAAGGGRADLAEWLLRHMDVVHSGQDDLPQMLADLAAMARPAPAAQKHQPARESYRILVQQLPAAVRAASAVWAELRSRGPAAPGGEDDQLLLATLRLEQGWEARWSGRAEEKFASVDMGSRPALLNLSFLQEWLLESCKAEYTYRTVAAGVVCLDKRPVQSKGGLHVIHVERLQQSNDYAIHLSFDGYHRPRQEAKVGPHMYVVKALPWAEHVPQLTIALQKFEEDYFVLRMSMNGPITQDSVESVRLMVEVSQFVP